MIAFDICARSISYPLCLISEFSSIIKIKTLLALPSMCHITSIFSKHHVQFLGTSAPWTYLEFQILLPCCMNWSCTLWDGMWPMEIHCFLILFPNSSPEMTYFSTSLLDWLVIPLSSHKDSPSTGKNWTKWVWVEYTFSVSSSILCCLLNFSFKQQLRILTQSLYLAAE